MDIAPEAAAICISALPLYGSPSVARYESSCNIACSDVIIAVAMQINKITSYIRSVCVYIYIRIYI